MSILWFPRCVSRSFVGINGFHSQTIWSRRSHNTAAAGGTGPVIARSSKSVGWLSAMRIHPPLPPSGSHWSVGPLPGTLVLCSQYGSNTGPPLNLDNEKKKHVESEIKHGENNGQETSPPLSRRQQLKQAVKDYGLIVIGFHICISLISLGSFYLLVSSGIDMMELLKKLGLGEHLEGRLAAAAGAGTFVVAYAVHKVFAPARIAVTLTAAPIIVNRLRKLGLLKKVK